jgi:hypothetical protein
MHQPEHARGFALLEVVKDSSRVPMVREVLVLSCVFLFIGRDRGKSYQLKHLTELDTHRFVVRDHETCGPSLLKIMLDHVHPQLYLFHAVDVLVSVLLVYGTHQHKFTSQTSQ